MPPPPKKVLKSQCKLFRKVVTREGHPKAKVIALTAAMVKVVPCTYEVLKSAKESTSPFQGKQLK